MCPVQPGKGRVGCVRRPAGKVPVQDERFRREQHECEQQPDAHHRMHPPEPRRSESPPQVSPCRHPESGQSNHDDCRARLPDKRMALVEVIVGSATSDETLARALDYVQQIRKTPIVVRDGYGFYTTRCVEAYIREGVRLLADGVNPALVEKAGTALGMPVGPLTLADEVGIDVLHHIISLFREREHGRWADDKHGAGNSAACCTSIAAREIV